MLKILITNAYSARNKGDAGIIIGMIRSLSDREGFRGAEFCISSSDYPADSELYSHPVVPSFQSVQGKFAKNRYVRMLVFLVAVFPLSLLWACIYRCFGRDLPIPRSLRELLRIYRESDLIIAAGGGYLYTTSKVLGNVVLLLNLFSFYFGVLLGKPVYLYSQSIGPFSSGFQSWLTKWALRGVRLIEVREQYSYHVMESWRIRTPYYLTVDSAFLVPSEEYPLPSEYPGNKLRMGITARKWFRNRKEQDSYERKLGEFLNWLISEKGVFVFFVPQVTYTKGNDDDRVTAKDIYSHIISKQCVCLIEAELRPQQIMGLCGEMDLFLGTRMHSTIYALCMNTPTLAIAYQPKTKGIMEQLNLGQYVIEIDGLDLELLKQKFEQLLRHRNEIRESLRERIPRIREQCQLSGHLIEQDYLFGAGPPGTKKSIDTLHRS